MTKTKKLVMLLCTAFAVLFVAVAVFGGAAGSSVSASAAKTNIAFTGLMPYQNSYNSVDDAAIAWGREYAALSIRQNREYGSIIYKNSNNGKYYFTSPAAGTRNSCYPSGTTKTGKVAVIHSHGKAEWDKGEEFFSGADYSFALSVGVKTIYVTTPEGKLLRGQAFGEKYHGSWWGNAFAAFTTIFTTKTVKKDMPHDKGALWQAIQFKHWGKKRCANCA